MRIAKIRNGYLCPKKENFSFDKRLFENCKFDSRNYYQYYA